MAHYIFTNFIPLLSHGSIIKLILLLCASFYDMDFSVFVYTDLPTVYVYLNYLVGECLHEYSRNEHEKNKALTSFSLEITLYRGWKLHYDLPAEDNYKSFFPSYFVYSWGEKKDVQLVIEVERCSSSNRRGMMAITKIPLSHARHKMSTS